MSDVNIDTTHLMNDGEDDWGVEGNEAENHNDQVVLENESIQPMEEHVVPPIQNTEPRSATMTETTVHLPVPTSLGGENTRNRMSFADYKQMLERLNSFREDAVADLTKQINDKEAQKATLDQEIATLKAELVGLGVAVAQAPTVAPTKGKPGRKKKSEVVAAPVATTTTAPAVLPMTQETVVKKEPTPRPKNEKTLAQVLAEQMLANPQKKLKDYAVLCLNPGGYNTTAQEVSFGNTVRAAMGKLRDEGVEVAGRGKLYAQEYEDGTWNLIPKK